MARSGKYSINKQNVLANIFDIRPLWSVLSRKGLKPKLAVESVTLVKVKDDLLSAATSVTMMDVEVEELCRSTVTRTPIMRPHTGFLSRSLCLNACPADLPGSAPREFYVFRSTCLKYYYDNDLND